MENTFVPAKRTSMAANVYEQLRLAIVECVYAPGALLQESVLAETFSCSNTPVREALRRLQAEGLVEVIPYKGYLVTPVSLRETQELLELRAGLEAMAAEFAATRASEAELEELDRLAEQSVFSGDPDTYRQYAHRNREFHLAVAKAAHNQRLCAMIESIFDQVQRLLLADLPSADPVTSTREHQDLVQALRRRQPAEARQIMVAQVMHTRDRLLRRR